ncbi:hypothetical protein KA082_01415 [Candidatus Woesebacteria bacterium]|nr:hypothetical protein [Candidatus Woesebacteria bacterium]
MPEQTISKLKTYHTPVLLVVPESGRDDERLLIAVLKEKYRIDQSKDHNGSEYIEINKSRSTIAIETLRELTETLSYSSLQGKERVIIIHRLDLAAPLAQNTLLKCIEEPPSHTILLFTTASTAKIIATIISRTEVVQLIDDTRTGDFDTTNATLIYSSIPQKNHQELIELAGAHNEKPAAMQLLRELLQVAKIHIEKPQATAEHQIAAQQLIRSLTYIEQNVQIKLVLEDCFFKLKAIL